MDRSLLAALGLPLLGAAPAGFAQSSSTPPSPPPPEAAAPPARAGKPGGSDRCDGPPFERFKKKLEKMAPEERERFRENWERWKKMDGREREDFRRKAEAERERMRKTIDDAIARAGLTLTPDQREVFGLRYRQERRKIEEELRAETESLRAAKIGAALERLKAEFKPRAPSPTASPSPSPGATPATP